MEKILELKNLRTYYSTDSGIAKAVDGVSFSLGRNSTLGVVGGVRVRKVSDCTLHYAPCAHAARLFCRRGDFLERE